MSHSYASSNETVCPEDVNWDVSCQMDWYSDCDDSMQGPAVNKVYAEKKSVVFYHMEIYNHGRRTLKHIPHSIIRHAAP